MSQSLSDLKIKEDLSVSELSFKYPLIFLLVRHNGCTYCRKSLAAFQSALPKIIAAGLYPVVIHMGSKEESSSIQSEYELKEATVLSDPERLYYKVFEARRGSLKEVLGPKVIAKGLLSGDLLKHGIGTVKSDPYQLGGAYYVHKNNIVPIHIPQNTADTEDWERLLKKIPSR